MFPQRRVSQTFGRRGHPEVNSGLVQRRDLWSEITILRVCHPYLALLSILTYLDTVSCGVAFHHAGLDGLDRQLVERAYLEGQINVICCTSTLAVGVNLPCHLVIVKNTVTWQDNAWKEYADLEIMQMLGRAGRWVGPM